MSIHYLMLLDFTRQYLFVWLCKPGMIPGAVALPYQCVGRCRACGTWSSKSLKTKCTVEVLCYCILLEMLDNPGFIFNANVKPRIIRIWSSLTALLPWHIRNCITRGILLIAGGRVTCTLLPEEQSTLSICSWMLRCCQLVVHWQVSLRMKNRGHGF